MRTGVFGALAATSLAAGAALGFVGSAAPAPATFPGGNGLIAFDRGSGIAVVRADRSDVASLIRNGADPAWSPDGRSIAFDRQTTLGTSDVFVANADGSGRRRVVSGGVDPSPSWSPDGTQLAYSDGEAIYVVRTDGTDRRAVYRGVLANVSGPTWSPSGEWIAFSGYSPDYCSPDADQTLIVLVHPDGSGAHVVLTRCETALPTLDWSPDGTRLVFDAAGFRGRGDIFVCDAAGKNIRQLTRSPGIEAMPAWSPDGSQIVYSLALVRGGVQLHADLYVMNADGTNVRPLVRGPAGKNGPDWQPAR